LSITKKLFFAFSIPEKSLAGLFMKNTHKILCIFAILILLNGCNPFAEEKKYVVGLSQCMMDDEWRQTMIKESRIEASNYDNLELVVRNADTNNKQQIEQIRELIDMRVDVLIISPNESETLTPVAEEAYKAGIPTIITDRKINSDQYTTFVGASNYDIGLAAGIYADEYLPQNAIILEIWGLATSSPAQERHKGFVDALLHRPDISFIKLDGEWRYDTTSVRIQRLISHEKIDFVYSHNDVMAIAAREYFMEQDTVRGKEIHIIGVDAVPGAGLEAVEDGRINISFMYPTGGEEVVRTAMRIIHGQPVERFIPLKTAKVDRNVAQTLLLQAEQLQNYQQRIENQLNRLNQLFGRYNFLQSSLFVILLLMIGFVILIIYVFRINKKVRQTNLALRETNRKEEEQRQKLIALNAEIKEVTAQKLQFFTNVSHEVRTPLTLILAPLEKLINLLHNSPYLSDLQLIQKNAHRLLRVINQILDFRKIEGKQEKLKIRKTEIVTFTHEVKSYFDSMAEVRHIYYTFTPEVKQYHIWIDPDLLEKVLVNLLSNAFKFTPENGGIHIRLFEQEHTIILQVQDTGNGIKVENIPYLFDRFYTEDRTTGTGIGLHLVAEYIRMHNGLIDVESKPGEGTLFTITLLKGKNHLTDEHITELPDSYLSYVASNLDDSEEKALLSRQYPYTILLVEDDMEVRNYLLKELQEQFNIQVATNGKEALERLEREEEISLVLTDVMMPEINGFELCRSIKTNLSYSHIPVILLTALSDERQRIFGISGGADAYIQKPFHINYIKIKIIHILEERRRMREQLLYKLQESHLLIGEPEKAENIDDLFLRKFLDRLEEIYTDSDYNIEKLSETLGLSRGHLHRKIKDLTGTSPVDFLRNFRLAKATLLLRQNQYTISEIAYQTGFTSPAYFSKCFKTEHKMTPKEYQVKEKI